MNKIIESISKLLSLPHRSVENTVALLDEGATVPFISRYRKERTGSLDETEVRAVETTLKTVRELEARKDFVRETLAASGSLTPVLEKRLDEAASLTDVEDIYAPFKPKRRTRATAAREKGLEPFAKMIMSGKPSDCEISAGRFVGKEGVADAEEALAGAKDIIAEWASESTRLRNITRREYRQSAKIVCSPAKGKEKELADSVYSQYSSFTRGIRNMPSHQYLALRRAEREGLIKVKFDIGERASDLESSLAGAFTPPMASRSCARVIEEAVADASRRLLRPSVENEIAASLKEEADRVAIDIFSSNLRQLLLSAPLKGKRVLAIDPGYRTGCKVVALDAQGNLLDDSVIYPTAPRLDFDGAEKTLRRMITRNRSEVISLGNGTASRETEKFLKERKIIDSSKIFVVSEDGASVYSASDIARREMPDKDVTVRGAVSIGRRLIDPLAELVKIDPKSIGVGQYQHDVDQAKLNDALDFTVVSCVNSVGVDLNTASEKLLSYISGIGPSLASNIVSYRKENENFSSRSELKKVPRLGDKAFELAAGFLRVPGGSEPLDNTGIHPESYSLVKKMARSINADVADLPGNDSLLNRIDIENLAAEGIGGRETMTDIISELRKPGRDPRTDDNSSGFKPAVDSFEQLSIGMTLPGLINNITAFGAFVDLGIKENGLIHISQLSRKRVNAVSDVVKLGQQVDVRIIDIDTARRRISLSLI